jgi:hypothetical protein
MHKKSTKKKTLSKKPDHILRQSFQNNYYTTQEFISFIETLTKRTAEHVELAQTRIPCIKKTCLSLTPFTDDDISVAKAKKISLQRILPQLNTEESYTPRTVLEYSILPTTDYETVFNNYHKNFRTQVRQAEKNNLTFSFFETENDLKRIGLTLTDIYTIYKKQMKRLFSFQFPYSYFTTCLALPHAKGAVVISDNRPIAYAFLFENIENIYISIAGADIACARLRPANLLYDRIIRYACEHHKNVHCGEGSAASGGNRFKRKAGFLPFQIQMVPDHEKVVGRFERLLQKPGARNVLRFLLKNWSTYSSSSFFRTIIPFT